MREKSSFTDAGFADKREQRRAGGVTTTACPGTNAFLPDAMVRPGCSRSVVAGQRGYAGRLGGRARRDTGESPVLLRQVRITQTPVQRQHSESPSADEDNESNKIKQDHSKHSGSLSLGYLVTLDAMSAKLGNG
jgi:hypothetical protein